MKWIKASQRLPQVPENASGLIIIREIKNNDNYKTSWYSNLPNGRGGNSLLKKYPSRYEWLDETNDEWIMVKEELPDYDEYVLWYSEDGRMFVEALDKDGNPWMFGEEFEGFKIAPCTHWRPLPKPPIQY